MLNRIPGYTGYKSKEQARDSDRVLRNEIARQLEADATRVEAIQRAAADDRNVARVNELEPVVQGFRNAANLVRSLSYGYGGLFSDRPVDDAALAQLRLFDEGLLVKVTALQTGVESIEAGDAGAATRHHQSDCRFQVRTRSARQRHRSGTPRQTGQAATKARAGHRKSVRRRRQEDSQRRVELPDLSLGDAMSILGDDHLVEALIDVDTGTSTERFIRLDNKPQMWLWVSTNPTQTPQRLLASEEATGVTWSETAGKRRSRCQTSAPRSGPGVIRTADSIGAMPWFSSKSMARCRTSRPATSTTTISKPTGPSEIIVSGAKCQSSSAN